MASLKLRWLHLWLLLVLVVYLTQLIPANNLDDQDKVRILTYQALVD